MDEKVKELVGRGVAAGVLRAGAEAVVARAPGRLDVMGGIADYSGSLVLQMPIAEATWAAAQAAEDGNVLIVSGDRRAEIPLRRLVDSDYAAARELFAGDGHWAAYIAGVVTVLAREKGVRPGGGLRVLIDSEVPEGKGVSSSAAVEVATMQAAAALWGVAVEPAELAVLCQKAENLVAGAPCGVMDQMASACGEAGKLLALRCQPAEVLGHVELPKGVGVWGVDSGVRHAVTGADYGTVRTAAFMGYRVLIDSAGGDRWGGYLANVTPSEYARLEIVLPEGLRGDDFLSRHRDHGDPVTAVQPDKVYPVRAATRHPIGEHHRIRCFAKLLQAPLDDETLRLLGEMMHQSHASYSACGLGSEGTDRLVARVREAGPAEGLFGAKITGGGCGGTVAILGRADAEPAVRAIAERYRKQAGRGGYVFRGSSPGACAWGVRRVAA